MKVLDEVLVNYESKVKVHRGLTITTSSTLMESKDWAEKLSKLNVLCVDCETSILYTINYIHRIPTIVLPVVLLIVTDHLIRQALYTDTEELRDRVNRTTKLVVEIALNTLTKYHELISQKHHEKHKVHS